MSQKPTNVVLMTCHDLGRFLRCYGIPTVRTPNLDRFAEDGVLFTSAFATAPQCSPSRSSIFTGRYPHANGVLGLTHGEFGWDLHPDEKHLAQVLGEAGYHTTMIGIMHEAREFERCGFHEVVFPGHDAQEGAGKAIETLRERAGEDKPFYLQLGFHEPHRVPACTEHDADYLGFSGYYMKRDDTEGITIPPFILDDDGARQEMAEIQGAVHHLDAAVGRVLEEIDRLGLRTNTLVIFTTDHGLALPRAKCSLYDPGLEVALLMRLPLRGWTGDKRITGLVSNIDIFPTVLDATGIQIPENVHGMSLGPRMESESVPGREHVYGEITYHDYYQPQRCIRTRRYKLLANFTTAPAFMDPSQSWHRRVRPVFPEDPALSYGLPLELYDLERDPNEWNNLVDDPDYEEVRRQLLTRLSGWMAETGDPLMEGAVVSPRHRTVVSMMEQATER